MNFAGVSEVDVMKDIMVSGGADGFAVLSGAENMFSEDIPVAEPSSLSVLGASLIIMGGLIRRKLGV